MYKRKKVTIMAASDIKRREMILSGNLFRVVLYICTPLAIYQLFNSAYNLIDQIICAQILAAHLFFIYH